MPRRRPRPIPETAAETEVDRGLRRRAEMEVASRLRGGARSQASGVAGDVGGLLLRDILADSVAWGPGELHLAGCDLAQGGDGSSVLAAHEELGALHELARTPGSQD